MAGDLCMGGIRNQVSSWEMGFNQQINKSTNNYAYGADRTAVTSLHRQRQTGKCDTCSGEFVKVYKIFDKYQSLA
jgi:hypothetical protein